MADDSLTARNRINQRNFRARRQNYIKELEERIRKFESEGVQATIEIQAAARQVTDQNIKLRNLLVQRFGMTEYEIANYLGVSSQHLLNQTHQLLSAFGSNSVMPKQVNDLLHSYPTPPQLSDPPRTLTTAHLDPALSLASLHKHPSVSQDLSPLSELNPYRHDPDLSMSQLSHSKLSPYDTRPPDSPTDTLSESSIPTTPADQQMHVDQPLRLSRQPTNPQQHVAVLYNRQDSPTVPPSSTKPAVHRPNDETSCEEAARIIASMRGGGGDTNKTADQVMLELGCTSPDASCQVKTLNVFQLIDRA